MVQELRGLSQEMKATDRKFANFCRYGVNKVAEIAPVRPGPYTGTQVHVCVLECVHVCTCTRVWLSFSLQQRARNRLCRYCIVFIQNHCDVLPHIMHKVTFTSRLTVHIFVEMSVCMYVCRSTARLGILINI